MNILIVDDEPKIQKGLRHVVEWWKYDIKIVGSVSNGAEAFDLINTPETEVDIVISDVEMPVMNGIELAKKIYEEFPGIKIIILSGYDNFDYAKQAMSYGVTNYLLKPVDEEELLTTVLKLKKQIEDKAFSYPSEYEALFLDNIENFKSYILTNKVDDLFDYFNRARYTLSQVKGTLNILFLKIEDTLLPNGVTYKDISNQDEYQKKNMESESIEDIKKLFIDCLLNLAEHKSSSKSLTIINQIKKYIRENLSSEISLNSVAEEFLLNSCYLSQLFQKNYDGGFSSFITDLKIEKAKKLLQDKNLTISEISELVGYSDVKYFSTLFKNKVGKRPSEFRS